MPSSRDLFIYINAYPYIIIQQEEIEDESGTPLWLVVLVPQISY